MKIRNAFRIALLLLAPLFSHPAFAELIATQSYVKPGCAWGPYTTNSLPGPVIRSRSLICDGISVAAVTEISSPSFSTHCSFTVIEGYTLAANPSCSAYSISKRSVTIFATQSYLKPGCTWSPLFNSGISANPLLQAKFLNCDGIVAGTQLVLTYTGTASNSTQCSISANASSGYFLAPNASCSNYSIQKYD